MRKIICIAVVLITTLSSCKKYLDEKPDTKLAVPTTLNDLQALLDNYSYMSTRDASYGEISADDYYLNDADYNALTEGLRNMYQWSEGDFYKDISGSDWGNAYNSVYFANTALGGLQSIPASNMNLVQWKNVKGQALFYRSKRFFDLMQVFAKAYDATTADRDAGIVLRLNADFTEKSIRASIAESYRQITTDVKEAAELLPVMPITLLRPSKPAAYGMLARMYLAMRMYDSCLKYTELSLGLNGTLINYNTLTATATYPISRFSTEVLFDAQGTMYDPLLMTKCKIDSALYSSYGTNDLRKTIFFKSNGNGSYAFKGNYTGNDAIFSGIATNELYLMKAECLARQGKTNEALTALNALLITRYKTGLFTPVTSVNAADALQKVLAERRKELVMRCLRWMDLKRLNIEGAGIVLRRKINNVIYTLAPNSNRYTLPIEEDVIRITGMEQNPK